MSASAVLPIASDFAAVVRHRSWEWLAALQRRLNVDRLQILDEYGVPLVPEPAAPWTAILRAPEVTATLSRALQSKMPESVRLGQMQVSCVGLLSGHSRGAMLLARAVTEDTASKSRTELELIGTWLRPAIEAHLGSAQPDDSDYVPRVSSLFKVLNSAGSGGNESTLLRLFADALAIWHDVDLRAYVEDVEGNFRLEVALPGAPTATVPAILNGDEITVAAELSRVSSHDVEFLGFRAGDDVMAARVGSAPEGMAWLLVLSGSVESAGEGRLVIYTDILRQALQNVASTSLLAIERAVWQRLVSADDQMSVAAGKALHELQIAIGGEAAALSISLPRSGRFVRVGDVDLLDDVGPSRLDRLTTTVRIDDAGTLLLAVQGLEGRVFTSRDRRIVQIGGQLFGSWAGGVLRRAPTAFERRAISRPFEDVLEQAATQSAAQGATVSVVVIQMTDVEMSPERARRVAAQIRAHIRAGEPVGVLGGGEVGLLLHDCAPEVARAVVARLLDSVAGGEAQVLLAGSKVGIVHVGPGSPTHQLVKAARDDAHRAPQVVQGDEDGL